MIRSSAAYPPLVMDWIEVEPGTNALIVGPDREGIYLSHIEIKPESVSPGTVELRNGSAAAAEIYSGGSGATRDRWVVDGHSNDGPWSVTTGSGVRIFVSVQKQ